MNKEPHQNRRVAPTEASLTEEKKDFDPLAVWLMGEFVETAHLRYNQECHWLSIHERLFSRTDVARAVQDEYGSKESGTDESSHARIRIARTKSEQTTARINDMLFQGKMRAYGIEPTEKPDLPDEVIQEAIMKRVQEKFEDLSDQYGALTDEELLAQQAAGEMPDFTQMQAQIQQGQTPILLQIPPEEMEELILETAKARSDKMESQMVDQLNQEKYAREGRMTLRSGNNYGTGWMQGPDTREITQSEYRYNAETQKHESVEVEKLMPFFTATSIWDTYPYPHGISDPAQANGGFLRQKLSKTQLRDMVREIPGYDREKVEKYIAANPKGDMNFQYHWESTLWNTRPGSTGSHYSMSGMYEWVRFTGYIDGHDLIEAGVDGVTEANASETHRVQIEMLGPHVIRSVKMDLPSQFPYYMRYVFSDDETSVFGEGVLDQMDDPERLFQSATRALIDDMSRIGNVFFVDTDQIAADELKNARDLRGGDTIFYSGQGYRNGMIPIHQSEIKSQSDKLSGVMNMARELADEATGMPRVAGGMSDGSTEKTVGGMSMKLAQANIVLKEPIHQYVEGILKPSLEALYWWNNTYGPEENKGDMEVRVEDIESLLARETQAAQIEAFAVGTANPFDAPYINREELNRARARSLDLSEDKMVFTQEAVDKKQEAMAEQARQSGATQ